MIKSIEKRIGIIGGLGPDSTLEYYRGIINLFRSHQMTIDYPEILIYSVNLSEFVKLIKGKEEVLIRWFLEKIEILNKANVDIIAIASNTPHILLDKLRAQSPIQIISIVEETLKYIKTLNIRKVGLIGTKTTMGTDLYHKPFFEQGIEVFVPGEDEQETIHNKIFSELEIGLRKESTHELILGYIRDLIVRHQIEGLILGCTELPIMFPKDELGIPFINTTKLHIEGIVDFCLL